MTTATSPFRLDGLKLAYRLASALRRYGPGDVLRFAVGVARRRGLSGAVGYALSRGQVAVAPPAEADPHDLDRQFSLSQAAWTAWLKRWETAQAANVEDPEDRARATPVTFFIGAGEPQAVQHTVESIEVIRPKGANLITIATSGGWKTSGEADAYIVFLNAGDRLTHNFFNSLHRAIRVRRTELVTFDLVHRAGDRVFPLFLPGANPTYAEAVPELYARFAIARSVLPPNWRPEASAHDHLLAWLDSRTPRVARGRWRHIGREPLVELAFAPQLKPKPTPMRLPEIRSPSVSVVVCTKDKGHLTRQLVRSLLANQPDVLDVVIVANETSSPHALQTLADLALSPQVKVIRQDGAFNFSKLANAGARAGQGAHLLFLNDDITPVSEDWLERMLNALAAPMVGTVGPLLVYPNERVQHAGMHLGYRGCAGHSLRHAVLPQDDYLALASATREVSTLTGAALLTPRNVFDALNGFDERLGTFLQDVDYCLRASRGGFANVYEPGAVLIHMESTSILEAPAGTMDSRRQREHAYFVGRWGETLKDDTLHPSGLSLEDESLRTLREP
jgi:GT2 family glycosyltransferase